MNVSKYVIEIFQRQKSGTLVNVASVHGMNGQYDAISYAAAKAGVINITQSYAKLLTPFGRANSVSPPHPLVPATGLPALKKFGNMLYQMELTLIEVYLLNKRFIDFQFIDR